MNNHFEVNDRISFSGAEGVVTNITTDPYALMIDFPVHVVMDNGMHLHFTSDGRFMRTQKYPVIVKIGKVKPKIKKYQAAIFVDDEWLLSGFITEDDVILKRYPHEIIRASMVECDQ